MWVFNIENKPQTTRNMDIVPFFYRIINRNIIK